MANNQNTFEKRQREMAKKRKADEKRQRKAERKDGDKPSGPVFAEVSPTGEVIPIAPESTDE